MVSLKAHRTVQNLKPLSYGFECNTLITRLRVLFYLHLLMRRRKKTCHSHRLGSYMYCNVDRRSLILLISFCRKRMVSTYESYPSDVYPKESASILADADWHTCCSKHCSQNIGNRKHPRYFIRSSNSFANAPTWFGILFFMER